MNNGQQITIAIRIFKAKHNKHYILGDFSPVRVSSVMHRVNYFLIHTLSANVMGGI